ncbi:hypothetical protein EV714DRAFT_282721 [Schizophyllum commune]
MLRRVSSALFTSLGCAKLFNTPTSIQHLPNEMLTEVACFLSKADQVALIRVNRHFHALVEPLIWRELTSIVPLLLLLPEYFELEDVPLPPRSPAGRTGIDFKCLRRLCDLSPDMWRDIPNLERLAGHVRKLLLHPCSDIHWDVKHPTFIQSGRLVIDWTTFKAVAKSLQGARDVQLLPNLQSLEVNSCLIRGLSTQMLIPFLTGGNVTTFESHCALSRFGRCLARGELKTFGYYEPSPEIVGWPDQQDALLIPALRDLEPKIHTLDALRLRLSYGQQLLPLLHPAAETLKALDVEIKRLIGAVPDYGLDNLRSLTVRKQKAAFVRALAGSPYLEHVHFQDVTLANADGMSVAMERLGTAALRRLHIEEKIPQRSDPAWYLERCHLDALASAHRLVELDLHASNGISLTDEDWTSLIPSWPCLRYFRLQPGRRRRSRDAVPYVPQATLATLMHFARYCPDLGELSIPLNVDGVPSLANEPEVCKNHLIKVDLGLCSAIRADVDPTRVAGFLRRLFPALRELQVTAARPADIDTWDQVKQTLVA